MFIDRNRFKVVALLVVAVAVAVVASACFGPADEAEEGVLTEGLNIEPAPVRECFGDVWCDAGYRCVDGECVYWGPLPRPECIETWHCPRFMVCEDFRCVPWEPECFSDIDCDAGYRCESYECVFACPLPAVECLEDCHCPRGMACERMRCVPARRLVP